ncbi:MAG: antibiotic biosynthesis monooxygenase [Xanthomonadales bacterium]|nr:antibiotic biosynthesis monooxygenase [Xanthomonadales bacterium]
MFVVCVTFEIQPKQYAAFRQAVQNQAANSLQQEADCHVFDVCINADHDTVFLYEHYSDRAAFDAHLQSQHFLNFDAQTRPWVLNKSVTSWKLLEHTT